MSRGPPIPLSQSQNTVMASPDDIAPGDAAPGTAGSGREGPTFHLLDSGETRADLASRREIKYAIPRMDIAKLRGLLEANCRRLVHNDRISVVRSIYFDDVRLSACRANLDGLGIRRKLRLRWYDVLSPGTDFFFEIKWRDNRVTGKHRLQIRSDEPIAKLSYSSIRRNLAAVVPEHLMHDLVKYSEPTVIVQYNREHFATDDGLRITMDYDLTYYDQTGRQLVSTSFPHQLEGLVVVEGKTPVGREGELRRWLHPFSPRAGRCSKYVQGCCQVGLIRQSEQ